VGVVRRNGEINSRMLSRVVMNDVNAHMHFVRLGILFLEYFSTSFLSTCITVWQLAGTPYLRKLYIHLYCLYVRHTQI